MCGWTVSSCSRAVLCNLALARVLLSLNLNNKQNGATFCAETTAKNCPALLPVSVYRAVRAEQITVWNINYCDRYLSARAKQSQAKSAKKAREWMGDIFSAELETYFSRSGNTQSNGSENGSQKWLKMVFDLQFSVSKYVEYLNYLIFKKNRIKYV